MSWWNSVLSVIVPCGTNGSMYVATSSFLMRDRILACGEWGMGWWMAVSFCLLHFSPDCFRNSCTLRSSLSLPVKQLLEIICGSPLEGAFERFTYISKGEADHNVPARICRLLVRLAY